MKYTPKNGGQLTAYFLFVKYFIHFTICIILGLPSIAVEYSLKIGHHTFEFVPTNRNGIKSVLNTHLNCIEFAYNDDNAVTAVSLTFGEVFC